MEEKKQGAKLFNELVAGKMNELSVYQAAKNILACNDYTGNYLLTLTEKEAYEIVEHKNESLKENGLIEIKGGVVPLIIDNFCDSAYVDNHNYASLLRCFSTAFMTIRKAIPADGASDEEILSCMRADFDEYCSGDITCFEQVSVPFIIKFYNFRNSLNNYKHSPEWLNPGMSEEVLYE